MDENIYKIALAAFLHDIGKFAERAAVKEREKNEKETLEMAFYPDKEFLVNNEHLYQPEYNGSPTHRHAVFSAAFIDHLEKLLPEEFNSAHWGLDDPFINLAAGHHKPESPLQWIVAMADRLSSGFDRDEFDEYNKEINISDYKKTRLIPVLEGISIEKNEKKKSLKDFRFRYPLKEISPEGIFPEESRGPDEQEMASREYRDLFAEFVCGLERMSSHKRSIPNWFEYFDSLMMRYTSHIPAATVGRVIPDVSLYDHLRTTAAIASALYRYHFENDDMAVESIKNRETEKFLVVTGDFHGIQNFIFEAGGSTNRASAKLLRGRSFAVSLLAELAAHLLCEKLGLTHVSVVLNAAGKFTLLAQNTASAREAIREAEEEINDWLIDKYFGQSTMGIAFIEASAEDFTSKNFKGLWGKLAREAERKKFRKIDVERYGGAAERFLDTFNNELEPPLCPFCGRRPSEAELEDFGGDNVRYACAVCYDHIHLGTEIVKPDKKRLAVFSVDADIRGRKLKAPLFDRYQLSFDVSGRLSEVAQTGALKKYWLIRTWDIEDEDRDITFKFINGYVPACSEEDLNDERLIAGKKSEKKELELLESGVGDPKTFLHIAKMALNKNKQDKGFLGIEALGVLKADVDNLGLIFATGLEHLSISRLATLSRQMNYFFSLYLPHLLSSDSRFRDVYTVFTGGDDLFLIGPWNRIVELSMCLENKFNVYVCGNPDITVSAGISIHKPSDPVPFLRDSSEAALDASKGQRAGGKRKNAVTLFGQTVGWNEYHELLEIKKKIEEWLDKKLINSAMLFRWSNMAHLAESERKLMESGVEGVGREDWECLKWRSQFKYSLVRNAGKNLQKEERLEAIAEVERASEWFERFRGAMTIPLWCVIYNRR